MQLRKDESIPQGPGVDRDMDPTTGGRLLDRYLRQAVRYPLLTQEDEIRLAKQAEAGYARMLELLARAPGADAELRRVARLLRRNVRDVSDILVDDAAAEPDDARISLARLLERCGRHSSTRESDRSRRLREQALRALADARPSRAFLDELTRVVHEATKGSESALLAEVARARGLAEDAKAQLVESNLRLVLYFAKRYTGRGLDMLDLIQEGNFGLMRAADKFDHRRGYRFATYAAWWVRQFLGRALSDQGRTIRIPVHMLDAASRLKRTGQRVARELGRDPEVDELALAASLPAEKVRAMLELVREPLSLELPVGPEREARLGEFVADTRVPTPELLLDEKKLARDANALLGTLGPRERKVLGMRYGLSHERDHTLQEIGDALSLTRERVRQIEARALSKLRVRAERRKLRPFG